MPLDDTASPKDAIAPPHNLSAESAVLGAILFDNNSYQRVADILRASDFYAPAHQELYEVASIMIQQGRIADGVTLREHFEKAEKLSEIGGARYLEQLLDSAAFGAEVGDYAHMIRDLAMRRSLVGIGSDLQGRALTLPRKKAASARSSWLNASCSTSPSAAPPAAALPASPKR